MINKQFSNFKQRLHFINNLLNDEISISESEATTLQSRIIERSNILELIDCIDIMKDTIEEMQGELTLTYMECKLLTANLNDLRCDVQCYL